VRTGLRTGQLGDARTWGRTNWRWYAVHRALRRTAPAPRARVAHDALRRLLCRREQAVELLGKDFSGVLHRDRWKPYEQFELATHQLCHSHLRRDFQGMLESQGETGTQGAMLKLASDKAFHLWHQFEWSEIDRPALIRQMKPIEKEIKQRLEILKNHPGTTKKARGTAADLLRQWGKIWTFVHREGVTSLRSLMHLRPGRA